MADEGTIFSVDNENSINTVNKVKKTRKPRKTQVSETEAFDFASLRGKLLVVKVGNDVQPASDDDITDIDRTLTKLVKKNNIGCAVFVTHHLVNVSLVG